MDGQEKAGREWRGRAALATVAAGAALAAYVAARRDRPDAVAQAAYPPLDTPKPVVDGVWVVDAEPLVTLGLPISVRMTVLRLANGDLLLHSPTRFTPALAARLEALGRIRHLIAPNSAHWMFAKRWQRAYPDAVTWAAPGLRDRGQVRRSGLRLDEDLGDAAPAAWAGEIEQGIVPGGLGFREAYLFHRASGTLILTDLVQNMEPAKLPPRARALVRLAGATQAKPAAHLRAVLGLGGEAAADAIRRMIALAPERVIFAHGRWFEADGSARLERALGSLVGPAPG